MTAVEINIGFGALLETFEMMIFAFLHVKSFSYKPYRPLRDSRPLPMRTSRLKALGHVLDFRETLRELVAGMKWMCDWSGRREKRVDRSVWREVHLERALGRGRHATKNRGKQPQEVGFATEAVADPAKEGGANRGGEWALRGGDHRYSRVECRDDFLDVRARNISGGLGADFGQDLLYRGASVPPSDLYWD
jgi:hypothetical protein